MEKAVIFTHIDERNSLEDWTSIKAFYEHRGAFFRSCIACSNISIVFVYSSYGVNACIKALQQGPPLSIPIYVLENEQRVNNALQMVLDRAALHVGGANARWYKEHGPEFVFIGVRELAAYLNRLMRIDQQLVTSLIPVGGESTYDSPKNIEAIIRIKRQFEGETIIRVDADVQVNEAAIAAILARAKLSKDDCNFQPYWWFSGCYRGNFADDPVNSHAVRQHWLVQTGTRHDKDAFALVPGAQCFLEDIAEIGATQFGEPHPPDLSRAAMKVVMDRGWSNRRKRAQVISGAGLVASAAAIEKLPPFMNASEPVVWIDDHLKRLLHEAIGDLTAEDPELIEAPLLQDRFPRGIDDHDEEQFRLATYVYFDRLLYGCLMEATILRRNARPGPLAECIHERVVHDKTSLTSQDEDELRRQIDRVVTERFTEVMQVWRNAEYGDDTLRLWAEKNDTAAKRDESCRLIGDIAVSYVRLCLDWERHVTAIRSLQPHDAYWLFTRPRPSAPVRSPSTAQQPATWVSGVPGVENAAPQSGGLSNKSGPAVAAESGDCASVEIT